MGACDSRARLLSVEVLPGNRHDVLGAPAVLAGLPEAPLWILADMGFDSKGFRAACEAMGATPVVPSRRNAKAKAHCPDWMCRNRSLVERLWAALKEWRGIATRYEKKARNWRAVVVLGGIVGWVKSIMRKVGK